MRGIVDAKVTIDDVPVAPKPAAVQTVMARIAAERLRRFRAAALEHMAARRQLLLVGAR
ncbi:MAG: hypothetical protein LBG60_01075 [Bifidobacteriaceae bacterium]|nr:hypothetical protein [Bifidobacteriaceae bacterium]